MTEGRKHNWGTWAQNALTGFRGGGDGGPSYIPILPRHGVFLFWVAGDGQRFAALFRQAWRKLPLWTRRRLLKHWRHARCHQYGSEPLTSPWPLIELVERKSDFDRGNSEDAYAQYNHRMCSFAFLAQAMDRFSDASVECAVAHELAHAVLCITDAESHLNPVNVRYDAWGFSQSEWDADELAEAWGFDVQARDEAAEEFYCQRPQEDAL